MRDAPEATRPSANRLTAALSRRRLAVLHARRASLEDPSGWPLRFGSRLALLPPRRTPPRVRRPRLPFPALPLLRTAPSVALFSLSAAAAPAPRRLRLGGRTARLHRSSWLRRPQLHPHPPTSLPARSSGTRLARVDLTSAAPPGEQVRPAICPRSFPWHRRSCRRCWTGGPAAIDVTPCPPRRQT